MAGAWVESSVPARSPGSCMHPQWHLSPIEAANLQGSLMPCLGAGLLGCWGSQSTPALPWARGQLLIHPLPSAQPGSTEARCSEGSWRGEMWPAEFLTTGTGWLPRTPLPCTYLVPPAMRCIC